MSTTGFRLPLADPTRLTLYHAPGACSRVVLSALEEIGATYDAVALHLVRGDQHTTEYAAVNPRAQVPALAKEGRVVTGTSVILHYLHHQNPKAGLLPIGDGPEIDHVYLSDLVWCADTLHPLVSHIRNPARWTAGDSESVHGKALATFAPLMRKIDSRLQNNGLWWYGREWSIMDVYLFWAYHVASSGGFDLSSYPAILAHRRAVRDRPSFRRALEIEQRCVDDLGVVFPAGFEL